MNLKLKGLMVLVVMLFMAISSSSYATPVWFLSPGNNPGGDLAFQSSVTGMTFVEEDFDGYESYGYPGPTLTYGGVDATLSMSNGNTIRAWQGSWDAGAGNPGGLYGAISGRALPSYGAYNYTFSFSGDDVVKGFGIWIFDDYTALADSFTMTVMGIDGTSWTSGVLDANPGETDHAIEGFLGVTLVDGIQSVTINNTGSGVFHLDHMQIASSPVPEPATVLLFGIGILGLAGISRKRK